MSDPTAVARTASAPRDRAADAVRVGGIGAVLAGIAFLATIAYTFGFLFSRGLSTGMLNSPAELLPWIHANTVPYVGLWWIYTLHFLLLLPAPRGLAVIAGEDRAAIRMATIAGVAGAVVGMVAAQINIATAPPLAIASATVPSTSLPGIWVQSELAGGLGLQFRLISDVLMAVWIGTTALTLVRLPGWRILGYAQLAVTVLVLIVYVGKPFDWVDLEPTLGFVLALIYLWTGIQLLRSRRA